MKIDSINQLNRAMKHMPLELVDECIQFLITREKNIHNYNYNAKLDSFDKFKYTLTYLKAIRPSSLNLIIQLLKQAILEYMKTICIGNNELVDGNISMKSNGHESVFCPKLLNINYHRANGNISGVVC